MIEILSNKKVKARKEHTCNYCGGKINKGEIYEISSLKYEGTIYPWKNHLKCDKLTSDLTMFDDLYGEGLDEETFNEIVQEFIYKNLSEDEWEIFDLTGEDAVNKAIEIVNKNKEV